MLNKLKQNQKNILTKFNGTLIYNFAKHYYLILIGHLGFCASFIITSNCP